MKPADEKEKAGEKNTKDEADKKMKPADEKKEAEEKEARHKADEKMKPADEKDKAEEKNPRDQAAGRMKAAEKKVAAAKKKARDEADEKMKAAEKTTKAAEKKVTNEADEKMKPADEKEENEETKARDEAAEMKPADEKEEAKEKKTRDRAAKKQSFAQSFSGLSEAEGTGELRSCSQRLILDGKKMMQLKTMPRAALVSCGVMSLAAIPSFATRLDDQGGDLALQLEMMANALAWLVLVLQGTWTHCCYDRWQWIFYHLAMLFLCLPAVLLFYETSAPSVEALTLNALGRTAPSATRDFEVWVCGTQKVWSGQKGGDLGTGGASFEDEEDKIACAWRQGFWALENPMQSKVVLFPYYGIISKNACHSATVFWLVRRMSNVPVFGMSMLMEGWLSLAIVLCFAFLRQQLQERANLEEEKDNLKAVQKACRRLLTSVCDCVIELDAQFQIRHGCSELGPGHGWLVKDGRQLEECMHSDSDWQLFLSQVCRPTPIHGWAACAFHLKIKEEREGKGVPMECFHVKFHVHGADRHLLAFCVYPAHEPARSEGSAFAQA
eukprot:g27344.t1